MNIVYAIKTNITEERIDLESCKMVNQLLKNIFDVMIYV